jgi:indole-3-glycerol phosphate synthase
MDILEKIVAYKKKEVEDRKSLYPVKLLERSIYFPTLPVSMSKYVSREDLTGIIAEFKRRSPSKGVINAYAPVERTTVGYMQAGASALSVLTDKPSFGGSNEDLTAARKYNYCPVIRKDFTIDEYQIIEAKSIGADAILLIAAILTPLQSKTLCAFAQSFGLEVLLEVHDERELAAHSDCTPNLIGVNNRNLKTFEVNVDVSKRLAEKIPGAPIKVSESGINDPSVIVELRQYGYCGFLMGESFMKHARPEKAARDFIVALRKLENAVHETTE